MAPRQRISVETGGDSRAKKAKIDNEEEKAPVQKDMATLRKSMSHEHGPLFNKRVNARKVRLDDYHQSIKKPMHLSMIKKHLDSNSYPSVILTFDNAIPVGNPVHAMEDCLKANFEDCRTMNSTVDKVKLHTDLEFSLSDNYSGEFHRLRVCNVVKGKEVDLDNLNYSQLRNLQQILTKYKNAQPTLRDNSTVRFEAATPSDSDSDSNSDSDSSSGDYIGV